MQRPPSAFIPGKSHWPTAKQWPLQSSATFHASSFADVVAAASRLREDATRLLATPASAATSTLDLMPKAALGQIQPSQWIADLRPIYERPFSPPVVPSAQQVLNEAGRVTFVLPPTPPNDAGLIVGSRIVSGGGGGPEDWDASFGALVRAYVHGGYPPAASLAQAIGMRNYMRARGASEAVLHRLMMEIGRMSMDFKHLWQGAPGGDW